MAGCCRRSKSAANALIDYCLHYCVASFCNPCTKSLAGVWNFKTPSPYVFSRTCWFVRAHRDKYELIVWRVLFTRDICSGSVGRFRYHRLSSRCIVVRACRCHVRRFKKKNSACQERKNTRFVLFDLQSYHVGGFDSIQIYFYYPRCIVIPFLCVFLFFVSCRPFIWYQCNSWKLDEAMYFFVAHYWSVYLAYVRQMGEWTSRFSPGARFSSRAAFTRLFREVFRLGRGYCIVGGRIVAIELLACVERDAEIHRAQPCTMIKRNSQRSIPTPPPDAWTSKRR